MAEAWVINASPIILLAKAGLIDLLPCVAIPLVVPEAVASAKRGRTIPRNVTFMLSTEMPSTR